jgi:hypothetical protein
MSLKLRGLNEKHAVATWNLGTISNSKFLLHASHAALPILNSSKLPSVVDEAEARLNKI